ncbi:hypothetical protein ACFY05_29330 [Microtetraspora fusca]|uniref:Uncharacterized protein n=1 Tax=Microtetraspora fusca TaxID=1997 RepID=A0ABW6VCA3_MICFU
MAEIFFRLLNLAVPAVVLFFVIYWSVRLAIRHEKRRKPSTRDLDRERHARVTAERAAQRREWKERQAQKGKPTDQ